MAATNTTSNHDIAVKTDALEKLLAEVNLLANRLRQGVVLSGHSLGSAENKVLQLLEQHGPMSVPNIARQRDTTRQNIQVLVNRLARSGLVEFSGNPAHKRSPLLHLTAAALDLCSQARGKESELLQRLASGLKADELDASTALLKNIRSSLQQSAPLNAPIRPTPPVRLSRERAQPQVSGGTAAPAEEEIPVSLL